MHKINLTSEFSEDIEGLSGKVTSQSEMLNHILSKTQNPNPPMKKFRSNPLESDFETADNNIDAKNSSRAANDKRLNHYLAQA
jgi:mRNA-degrading endonuclease YafQ of YafQ-DinJ toxin-antitoxin module